MGNIETIISKRLLTGPYFYGFNIGISNMQKKIEPFIVIGMPRGGTTFLYHNLKHHQGIYLPFRKEVSYFGANFARGEKWYRGLYEGLRDNQIAGDISPTYFLNEHAAQRIKDYNPDTKVILSVRDPVDWALSFYEQFSSFDNKMPAFKDFVCGNYHSKIGDEKVQIQFEDDYMFKRIEEYRSLFGKNLLIYNFDYFANNRQSVLQAIELFLGLEPFFHKGQFDDVPINASHRKNNKLISYLLSRESVISAIDWLFPRKLVVEMRGLFDRASVRKTNASDTNTRKSINRVIANEILGQQRTKLNELFKDGPLLLGNGKTFKL